MKKKKETGHYSKRKKERYLQKSKNNFVRVVVMALVFCFIIPFKKSDRIIK